MASNYDRRRANGPDESSAPVYNIKVASLESNGDSWAIDENILVHNPSVLPTELLHVKNVPLGHNDLSLNRVVLKQPFPRSDNRGALDPRPLYIQTGIIPNASGSALLEAGRTKIAVAIHGPRQVRGTPLVGEAVLSVLFQLSPFSSSERQQPGKDVERPELAAIVQQALLPAVRVELYPKSSIYVHVTVVDMDTSAVGCAAHAVTAASAALTEAGIEMYGLVTGSSASALTSVASDEQHWTVDPSHEEASNSSSHIVLCAMPAHERITCYNLQGPAYDASKVRQVTDALVSATGKSQAYNSAIRRKEDLPPNMLKYWKARYDLFSRFDEGTLLDEESWYSVTPEAIAYRIAVRCRSEVAMDACCGAGGNVIQFALTCKHVVALDIDPVKIELAKHNAAIYGVQDRITFLCGDLRDFARDYVGEGHGEDTTEGRWQGWDKRKIDVVFMSPPWGGVEYKNPAQLTNEPPDESCKYSDIYPLSELRPDGGSAIFKMSQKIAPRTVLFLPRNSDLDDIAKLRDESEKPVRIHIEECWIGYKLKALAVYYFPDIPGHDTEMTRYWPGNRPLRQERGITRDVSKKK
ncbi:putative diacylglycerol O-acyltransferase tgs1 [Malassezia cuniculi]|uniref:Trimethylguanosine synthase n=1 Tax=Malassezia cuniculi TaxID=948313 RepID=A0AAF0ER84_9BASI|nr:putative diacylglycerol O-acyltransferase tgs1 [Malassezia cuniculi]